MLIKMQVEDLVRGMYVEELDRPWTTTAFPFQGFLIRTEQDLAELRRCCQHVFVSNTKSRLEGEAARKIDEALRPFTRKSAISQISFEPWNGEEKLRRTVRNLNALKLAVDAEVADIYSEAARRHRVDPGRISMIAAEIYRALEKEPRIGQWVALMQTGEAGLAEHSRNVAVLAMGFARHLGLPEHLVTVIGEGALLHDIGLARVPAAVLGRAGTLNDRETRLVRLHPSYAKTCLEAYMQMPREIVEIIEQHHVRLDGSGYPGIPPKSVGRHVYIVAICDVFEEMTSYRSYRESLSLEAALIELDHMGKGELPAMLVQEFIAYLGIYPRGNFVVLQNGAVGVVVSSNLDQKTRPVLRMLRGPGGGETPDTYVDLSTMNRVERDAGWRIVKSMHPMKLAGTAGVDHVAATVL